MEHQIGITAEHGLEWQIILTENEAVIVRRHNPIVSPAKQPMMVAEPAPAQTTTPSTRTAPAFPRIYANMR